MPLCTFGDYVNGDQSATAAGEAPRRGARQDGILICLHDAGGYGRPQAPAYTRTAAEREVMCFYRH